MLRKILLVSLAVSATFWSPVAAAQKRSKSTGRPSATAPAKPPAPAPAPTSAPAAEPKASATPTEPTRPNESTTAASRLSVEGFAGGLFAFERPSAQIPGGGVVEVDVPPVFRWGARISSPFYQLDRGIDLEWVATIGMNHTGYEQEFLGYTMSASTLGVDVIPGLRGRFEVLPKLSLTGELGIGMQFARTAVRMTFAGETAQGSTAGLFRFAIGGAYAVNDKLSVFFEPIALHAYRGQGSSTGWSLQAGFAHVLGGTK